MQNTVIHRPKGCADQHLVSDNGQEWMFRQEMQEYSIQYALSHSTCCCILAHYCEEVLNWELYLDFQVYCQQTDWTMLFSFQWVLSSSGLRAMNSHSVYQIHLGSKFSHATRQVFFAEESYCGGSCLIAFAVSAAMLCTPL